MKLEQHLYVFVFIFFSTGSPQSFFPFSHSRPKSLSGLDDQIFRSDWVDVVDRNNAKETPLDI